MIFHNEADSMTKTGIEATSFIADNAFKKSNECVPDETLEARCQAGCVSFQNERPLAVLSHIF